MKLHFENVWKTKKYFNEQKSIFIKKIQFKLKDQKDDKKSTYL